MTPNTFYCENCEQESEGPECRDCGESCIEYCGVCGEALDNCNCEDDPELCECGRKWQECATRDDEDGQHEDR